MHYTERVVSLFGLDFPEYYAHNVFLVFFILLVIAKALIIYKSVNDYLYPQESSLVRSYLNLKKAVKTELKITFLPSFLWHLRLVLIKYYLPIIIHVIMCFIVMSILIYLAKKVYKNSHRRMDSGGLSTLENNPPQRIKDPPCGSRGQRPQ